VAGTKSTADANSVDLDRRDREPEALLEPLLVELAAGFISILKSSIQRVEAEGERGRIEK
jgi:hypothetical protein